MSLVKSLRKWAGNGHVWLYRRMGGRLVSMGHRIVIVTTTGAKSGEKRTIPLVAFAQDGGLVLVAAAGGRLNPGWYHNMVANPDVVVERDGRTCTMVARELVGPDRDAMWRKVIEGEPSYASFQRKTDRIIPVMMLEPPAIPTDPDDGRGRDPSPLG
jgi:deazaflavin-dependent oxidoreductase (nitroreductase family)